MKINTESKKERKTKKYKKKLDKIVGIERIKDRIESKP